MIKLTPFYSRNINAYNPFYEMERLEKAFFGDSTQPVMFKTDISDSGNAYIVESDLPGINKEDIDINIGDEVLTVKAERKYESSDENAGKYLRETGPWGGEERPASKKVRISPYCNRHRVCFSLKLSNNLVFAKLTLCLMEMLSPRNIPVLDNQT